MNEHVTVNNELEWEPLGAWWGGTATAVALLPEPDSEARVLIGSRAGLSLWENGADARPVANGMDDTGVVALASTAESLFAAGEAGRLYRNTPRLDGNWREIPAWAGLGVPTALAPSPEFDRDGVLLVGAPTGIFRSLDGGGSWEECNFGLLDTEILCLACAPDFSASNLVWAGSAGGGLYRSRNAGRAWRESGTGLADAPVQALAVAPDFSASQTVYAGLEEYGVYRSRDGGETWEAYGLQGMSVNCLALDDQGRLWAGTDNGLLRAEAGGEWQPVAAPAQVVLGLAVAAGQIAVAAYTAGCAWSGDGGDSWDAPAVALHVPPLVAAANATHWMALDADGQLAYSEDGGATWRELPTPETDGLFGIHGKLSVDGNPVYFAATGIGLCRWDGAEAWPMVADAPFIDHTALAVELSPTYASDSTLLVVGHDGALLVSVDGAETWREVTRPWGEQTLLQAHFAMRPGPVRHLLALSVQPTASGHFAVTLWHSEDLGAEWEVLAGLTTGVPAVVTAWPVDDREEALFLATQHRVVKIYKPGDDDDYAVHQHFFDEGVRVTAVAVAQDYASSGLVWAATTSGIHRSLDRGVTWDAWCELPASQAVVALVPGVAELRAVTLGGQVWRLSW